MPVLEASPGPQGGRTGSKESSWPFSVPRLQRPHRCPKRSSAQALQTIWASLRCPRDSHGASASQTPAGTWTWAGLTGLSGGHVGRAGIHAEATAGDPRLASPHHLDLTWLLQPLLSPTMGHDPAGVPLPVSEASQPPGSPPCFGVISPWPSASFCPWNVGRFGAGLGPCTAHFAGTHPEVHVKLMLKMATPTATTYPLPTLAPTSFSSKSNSIRV